ncbi:MAG TPA: hypothetical protein VIL47_00445 [Candidatus Bipolaricaulota bacterium]
MRWAGFLIILLSAWALQASTPASATLQARVGLDTVYLTKPAASPDGAIVTPFDLSLSLYRTVLRNLSFPETILCGADGRLYFTQTFAPQSVGAAASILIHQQQRVVEKSELTYHQLMRANQDGSSQAALVEWDSLTLQPSSLVATAQGDLYLGTTSQDGQPTQGLWRIANAFQQNGPQLGFPRLLIPPERFQSPLEPVSYSVRPQAMLTAGPFTGDLLIIDAPVPSLVPGGRVLRAQAPEFAEVVTFIPPSMDPQMQRPFKPAGLALTLQGDVLVTDFANDKVIRFAPDGEPLGVFAALKSPNQIAVGSDGLVYVTNLEFRGVNVTGGLFIFDTEGNLLASEQSPQFLRGVTVCPTL